MKTQSGFELSQDDILKGMSEGFFLLDTNFFIQRQVSDTLLDILNIKNPSGMPLLEMIQPFIERDHYYTIENYLGILIDSKVDEELIKNLNPVNRMEFKLVGDNGLTFSKFLTFKFLRVKNGQKILGIITSVVDDTEVHLLSSKMKEIEENFKKQLDWYTSIIQIDRKIMSEFISTTYVEIAEIQKCLMSDDQLEYRTICDQITRSLHLVKGNANLLDFTFFAKRLHALEEISIAVKNKEEIESNDFLPLIFGVQDLKENLDELEKLIKKLTSMDFQNNVVREQTMLESIRKMVTRLSFELKKEVTFDDDGFKAELVPPQYLFVVKNTLVQMVKNSMSHGIETPKVRKENNKNESGLIKITNAVKGNRFIMTYYDDGRGLQIEKLKEQAYKTGNWDAQEIERWDSKELINIIFKSGISSSDDSTLIHGRGFGMNLIKNQIDKFKGTIEVKSQEYEFCEFTISLPLTNEN